MDIRVLQGSTTDPLPFLLVQSSGPDAHIAPYLGATPARYLSKNAGPFVSASGSVSEIAHGDYETAASATDLNTAGPLIGYTPAGSGYDPCATLYEVVARLNSPLLMAGQTTYPLVFQLVSSTEKVSPVTGIVPVVLIRKRGGAYESPTGAVREIGFGWYALWPSAVDTGAAGPLALNATGAGAEPTDRTFYVQNPLGTGSVTFLEAIRTYLLNAASLSAITNLYLNETPPVSSTGTPTGWTPPILIINWLGRHPRFTNEPGYSAETMLQFTVTAADSLSAVALGDATFNALGPWTGSGGLRPVLTYSDGLEMTILPGNARLNASKVRWQNQLLWSYSIDATLIEARSLAID